MPKVPASAPKKKKQARAASEMKKFAGGKLRSGSKDGPVVKKPAQAKAIAMSESGQSTKNAPPPKGPPTDKQKPNLNARSSVAKNRRPRNRGRT